MATRKKSPVNKAKSKPKSRVVSTNLRSQQRGGIFSSQKAVLVAVLFALASIAVVATSFASTFPDMFNCRSYPNRISQKSSSNCISFLQSTGTLKVTGRWDAATERWAQTIKRTLPTKPKYAQRSSVTCETKPGYASKVVVDGYKRSCSYRKLPSGTWSKRTSAGLRMLCPFYYETEPRFSSANYRVCMKWR